MVLLAVAMTAEEYRALQLAKESLVKIMNRCIVHEAHGLPRTEHIKVHVREAMAELEKLSRA